MGHCLLDASNQADHHLLNTAQKSIGSRQHRLHQNSGMDLDDDGDDVQVLPFLVFVFVLVLQVLICLFEASGADVLVDKLKQVNQLFFQLNDQ